MNATKKRVPFVRSWVKRLSRDKIVKIARAMGYGDNDRGGATNWIVEAAKRDRLTVENLDQRYGRPL